MTNCLAIVGPGIRILLFSTKDNGNLEVSQAQIIQNNSYCKTTHCCSYLIFGACSCHPNKTGMTISL